MKRPKIYCLFANRTSLEPVSGDRINEIRFYRALSSFADVYYNDCLIDWENNIIGCPDKLREPSRDYDLYYIRHNHELFMRVGRPKITMAYPYDEAVYRDADAIVVTTNAWRDLIRDHDRSASAKSSLSKWFPEKIFQPKEIVNVRQTIDPAFCDVSGDRELFDWRATTLGSRIFGFFGRVTDETIPGVLVDAVRDVRRDLGGIADPMVAFSGSIRTALPTDTLNLGPVNYAQMPSLLRTTCAVLGQECNDSRFLGSGKVLDAMATGTPIVTRRNAVRDEQLGEEYPGSFVSDGEAYGLVRRVCTDDDFRAHLRAFVTARKAHFMPEASGRYILGELRDAGML